MTETAKTHLNPEYEDISEESVEATVVIPSRDEEETIGVCINKIKRVFDNNGIIGEIIVADNSQDLTPIIARKLGAKVVTPSKEGYGHAYMCAFEQAKGKYVVIGDADNTYDFLELPKLLKPLKNDEADLVIGSRFNGKMEKGAMPWHHRRIGNPVLTWFLNLFFNAGVSDAHSGFRAIKKETLEKLDLRAEGMEFASEMIMEAAQKGLRIKEVQVSYSKRINGNSKLSSFSDGWRHLKFMLIHAPNYLFVYPGLSMLSAGVLFILYMLLRVGLGSGSGAHYMIAGSLLATTGYQIVLFGFFADIYRRKQFPKFFTLEKGATIGALMFLVGFAQVLTMLSGWLETGFRPLPLIEYDLLGLTFIVLGLQTFFSSFMLSVIAGTKPYRRL
jgi:glycosyltransferase involved in cell wall biosynthesis